MRDVDKKLFAAVMIGDIDAINGVISDEGADVNAVDEFGNMPLHIAVLSGNSLSFKILIKKGAKVNAQNHFGYTSLYLATANGHSQFVQHLLNSINLADKCGNTPLMIAAAKGYEETVKKFLNHCANDDINHKGLTASDLAEKNGHQKLAVYIKEWFLKKELFSAMRSKNKEIIKKALEAVDLDIIDEYGYTPLVEASAHGSLEAVTELLNMRVSANSKNKSDLTAPLL